MNSMRVQVAFLSILSLWVLAATSSSRVHAQAGSVPALPDWAISRSAELTLTVECRDARHIRFEIRNVGASDTAVVLGSVIGNGRRYVIYRLDLIVTVPGAASTEHHYWPRDYPAAVGGTMGEWVHPLPIRSAYALSATPDDFFHSPRGRLTAIPAGAEWSLRLTIPSPRPEARLLAYWTGALTSNSCRTK